MILVTAANGKLGESIVSHLRNLGVIDVIAGVRNAEKYDGQVPM